jgi:hypothetical protein
MLKTHPEWQMVNGKWKKPEGFAISHLPFSIRPAFFSGLPGSTHDANTIRTDL